MIKYLYLIEGERVIKDRKMVIMSYMDASYLGEIKVDIKVGDGATLCYYSDREPATVIWVSPSQKTIKIQRDNYKRIDNNGMSDSQEYEYSRNEKGGIETARLDKFGHYKIPNGTLVIVGSRRKFYDYTF